MKRKTMPTIRPATAADLPLIRLLNVQLGYECNEQELAARFGAVQKLAPNHVVLVAELDGKTAGYVHVCEHLMLIYPLAGVIESLVVDEPVRDKGVGKALLKAAHAWAKERGFIDMWLGTRVERLDAHRFYVREGYKLEKTQGIFRRKL